MRQIIEWIFRSPWDQEKYTWQFVVGSWAASFIVIGCVVMTFRWFG